MEKPITLFVHEVRAVLEDRQTQLRRVVKPQPDFVYRVIGDTITALHNNQGAVYEISQAGKRRRVAPDSSFSELGLHGRFGWQRLLANTLQGIRAKGVSGLVFISRSQKRQGVFDCIVVPQEQEGHEKRPSLGLHGIPRVTKVADDADKTSGRQTGKQPANKSLVGNADRKLARSEGARSRNRGRKAPCVEIEKYGTRASPLGIETRIMQSASCRTHSWDEPICNVSYCRFQVGQILWVRETFSVSGNGYFYRADVMQPETVKYSWTPSLHMPRSASRLTLRVKAVRVERLQEISKEDAVFEGLVVVNNGYRLNGYGLPDWEQHECRFSPIDAYQRLWDNINAERAPWASNPFVWIITFERINP